MDAKQIKVQIETLLKEVSRALAASPHDDLSGGLSDTELMKIRAQLNAAIKRLAPAGSSYVNDADGITHGGFHGTAVVDLAGILSALGSDYELGYIQTVEELVHGTIFDDFLEMSTELHDKKFKDAAAVVAGSTLEEHIKKMAEKNSISVVDAKGKPKKFDTLSIALVKAGVFGEPQRKILAGWYGQRTAAAHGKYSEVINDEVKRMIDGIRDFMVRYPA